MATERLIQVAVVRADMFITRAGAALVGLLRASGAVVVVFCLIGLASITRPGRGKRRGR